PQPSAAATTIPSTSPIAQPVRQCSVAWTALRVSDPPWPWPCSCAIPPRYPIGVWLVPDLEVAPVRLEDGTGLEEAVVEVEVEVLRLQEVHDPDGRHRARELPPGPERVVALQRH